MNLDELTPNPNNPRKITDEKLEMLKKSLGEFGDLSGIIFNVRSKQLVGGHQRVKALPPDAEIKIELRHDVPTKTGTVAEGFALIDGERFKYREVDWDEIREKAANIAANKHGGEWDLPKLSEWLIELDHHNVDFDLVGFTSEELENFMVPVEKVPPGSDEDSVPSAPVTPNTKPGDIYHLGQHKLMCGDSTNLQQVTGLMDGELADMVFTDPPYNVAYEGSDGQTIKNDDMDDEKFLQFCRDFCSSYMAAMKPGAAIYMFHADTEGANFRRAFLEAGFKFSSTLIWNKSSLIMGLRDYHWKHEPCLYGWKPGAAHNWYSDRTQTTVFDHAKGSGEDNKMHPTCKPVSLVEYFMGNSSKRNDLVLDLFGGSGSTLIAAEKTDRRCFLMELDPKYCDVIVKRWEQYTGQKAVLQRADYLPEEEV